MTDELLDALTEHIEFCRRVYVSDVGRSVKSLQVLLFRCYIQL